MSWIAALFNVWGLVLSGKKNLWCWPVWMAASLAWIIYGFQTRQWAIVALDAIMFVQQLWAFREWRKDECRSTPFGATKDMTSTCSGIWPTRRLPEPAPSAKAQVSVCSYRPLDESFKNSTVRPLAWPRGRLMRPDGSFLTTVSRRTDG